MSWVVYGYLRLRAETWVVVCAAALDIGAELQPSARYLGLLREGAVEWNLEKGWMRYLTEVGPYRTVFHFFSLN